MTDPWHSFPTHFHITKMSQKSLINTCINFHVAQIKSSQSSISWGFSLLYPQGGKQLDCDDFDCVLNVVSQKYSILLNHKQQVNWILYAWYKGNCVYTDINPSNLVWWNICLMSYASIYVLYINNTISVSHCDFREVGGANLQALTLIL